MAIPLVIWFYGLSLKDVRDLTMKEFSVLSSGISEIRKLENPTEEKKKGKRDDSVQPLSRSALQNAGLVKRPKRNPKGRK